LRRCGRWESVGIVIDPPQGGTPTAVVAKAAALADRIIAAGERPARLLPDTPSPGCSEVDSLAFERKHLAALRATDVEASSTKTEGQPVGLALSGGGIRSATLSLGVLQALAEARLIRRLDYLSTVSGGGYIGCWLSAVLLGRCEAGDPDPIDATERLLWPGAPLEPSPEAPEISFLRSYSNYLTPRLGLFSADTLSALTGYLRNLALSLLLALTSGGLLVALLHALVAGVVALRGPWHTVLPWLSVAAQGLLLLSVACAALLLTLQSLDPRTRLAPGEMRLPMLQAIQRLHAGVGQAMLPMAAIGLLLAGLVLELARPVTASVPVVLKFGGYALLAMLAGALLAYILLDLYDNTSRSWQELFGWRKLWRSVDWQSQLIRMLAERFREALRYPVAALGCALVATGLLNWCASLESVPPSVALFRGPLLAALVVTVGAVAWLGAVGTVYAEPSREWLSRLLGSVVGLMLAWATIGLLFLQALPLLQWLSNPRWLAVLPATWVLPTAALLLAILARQRRQAPAALPGRGARSLRLLVLLGSALVALLFVGSLVVLFQQTLLLATGQAPAIADSWSSQRDGHYEALTQALKPPALSTLPAWPGFALEAGPWRAGVASAAWANWTDWAGRLWAWAPWGSMLVAAATATVLFFQGIDVNVFSLQNLYRNRLVRCYLGAARHATRMENPYGGFDPADDLPMAVLAHQRPLHLVNAALNITHGDDLALQQRKAASFCMTPLFCGYWLGASSFGRRGPQGGYVPTPLYASEPSSAGHASPGVMLGTAMATSGAAVSPQMGFASSGLLAFVLTLFNVRLGRWLPNTTSRQSLKLLARHSPGNAGGWYLKELLGRTNEKSDWVYLSDGGHFDNLGVYELVRRRCSLIIAVDAGADPSMDFGDLGNCVRKCRVDFGVDIDINPVEFGWDAVRRRSTVSHVLGKVHYPGKDGARAFDGDILYLKASLPTRGGGLPADVLAFANVDPQFPHQPTADQWFTESQFESYRQLGQWLAQLAVPQLRTLLDALATGTSAPTPPTSAVPPASATSAPAGV
jgi:hypothetical protein